MRPGRTGILSAETDVCSPVGGADLAEAADMAPQTAPDWEAVHHHAGLATAAWNRVLSAASSTDQQAAVSPAQAAVSMHLAAELAALAGKPRCSWSSSWPAA